MRHRAPLDRAPHIRITHSRSHVRTSRYARNPHPEFVQYFTPLSVSVGCADLPENLVHADLTESLTHWEMQIGDG